MCDIINLNKLPWKLYMLYYTLQKYFVPQFLNGYFFYHLPNLVWEKLITETYLSIFVCFNNNCNSAISVFSVYFKTLNRHK